MITTEQLWLAFAFAAIGTNLIGFWAIYRVTRKKK